MLTHRDTRLTVVDFFLQKKKFEIGALTQKFTFYTGDDEKAKHLFLLCKDIHMFTQTLKERLAEIKQSSYEGK